MKFSICNELFENWQIEKVFTTAAEIGYDGVEIAPFTLAPSVDEIKDVRRREIAKAAKDAGVEIVGLHWLLVKPEGLYINHPNADIRKRTRDYLDSLIHFCSDLGGRVLIFGSPRQRNVHEGLTYQQAWDYACETFAHCAETAQENGVYLCIEALPARETNFINTIEEALAMVRAVGKPNFRTMVDVKSMCSESQSFSELICSAGEYIMHVHANDASGRGPGMGDTDFRLVSSALNKIRYNGYISVEVFDYKPDPITIAKESLNYLKKTFSC
ncbi:MAG: sugar phosphate isomerase/epimerase family protein [Armatimonadota bacterium]|nr:sugar phosphate isomerase/epimerase family protein [Armatimonadota bacterium]